MRVVERGRQGQRTAQVVALGQFHHQCALLDAINRADIRMVQSRQHLRFAREAGHPLGILRERLRQNFDGDVAIQFGAGGAPAILNSDS